MAIFKLHIKRKVKRQERTMSRFIRIKRHFLRYGKLMATAHKYELSLPATCKILGEMGVIVPDDQIWSVNKRTKIIMTAKQQGYSVDIIGALVDLSGARVRQIIKAELEQKVRKAA